MKGTDPLPPSPEMIGLYLADLAAGSGRPLPFRSPRSSAVSRGLPGTTQRGFTLDRKDRHIATVLAGIKRKHARPPVQKEAICRGHLAMVATLPFDLRGLRDRAILLLGYAGGLRRSEIVSLDVHKDDTPDSGGWIEIFDKGVFCSPSTPRPAGAKSRSVVAQATRPAPFMRSSNGCTSDASTSGRSSSAPRVMANAPRKRGSTTSTSRG